MSFCILIIRKQEIENKYSIFFFKSEYILIQFEITFKL